MRSSSKRCAFDGTTASTRPMNDGPADGVLKVMVVDRDAASHALCHLALRGLRVDGRVVQMLHARSDEDAFDLLLLHQDVAVAVVDLRDDPPDRTAAVIRALRGRPDGHRIWIIMRGPATSEPADARIDGAADPALALHAAVLRGFRNLRAGRVATAAPLG
jgi:CheY-like chemotaxis protein